MVIYIEERERDGQKFDSRKRGRGLMVSIIKVLRILLAGWSFRLSEGKAFACTPALRFFCAWI